MENNGETLKRENFAPLLEKSIAKLNVSEIIQNGFKSTGLHPFSADAINYKKWFESSDPEKTVDEESTVDYHKMIENLKFTESHIDKNLLEQFKIQEKSAEWNGTVEDTGLFLFWQKIKKSITPEVQSGNNSVLVDDIDQPESDLQIQEKGFESEERGEIDNFLSDSLPLEEVTVYTVNDEGDLMLYSDEMNEIRENLDVDLVTDSSNGTLALVDHEPMEITAEKHIENTVLSERSLNGTLNSSPPNINSKKTLPNVPSPFKNALFWPSKNKDLKKRKAKEKIPTVYTSDAWLKYHDDKEAKKQKLDEEKEIKKAARLTKKAIKEAEGKVKKEKIEEKKKKKVVKKKKNPKK